MPNYALLDSGSVKTLPVQVFWEIQSPVTADEVTGLHKYIKFTKENVSLFE